MYISDLNNQQAAVFNISINVQGIQKKKKNNKNKIKPTLGFKCIAKEGHVPMGFKSKF